jgi:hypothetical protein
MLLSLIPLARANAAKPEIDPSYANGEVVYMIGPHMDTNPAPNVYAHAEELYIAAYPINPGGTDTDSKTLATGYRPQCDPCYHVGLPGVFAYHDHVLTGAPGAGTNGTANQFMAPWKIVILLYSPDAISAPGFRPVTSEAELDAAEAAHVFAPINPHGANQYEVEPGVLLICPLVSSHA